MGEGGAVHERELKEYEGQTKAMAATLHIAGVECICLPSLVACGCGECTTGFAMRHNIGVARVRKSEGGHP